MKIIDSYYRVIALSPYISWEITEKGSSTEEVCKKVLEDLVRVNKESWNNNGSWTFLSEHIKKEYNNNLEQCLLDCNVEAVQVIYLFGCEVELPWTKGEMTYQDLVG